MSEREYSGSIKLRLPKRLHETLIRKAQLQGVSLNQYCLYILAEGNLTFGAKKINEQLRKIRDKSDLCNINEVISKVKELDNTVKNFKPEIIEAIKNILENKSKLSENDILDLEFIYPLIDGNLMRSKYPCIKRPNVKMVLEMGNEYIDYFKLKSKLENLFGNEILVAIGYSDDIADMFIINNFVTNDLTINFLNFDLEKVKETYERIEKILNSEMESILNLKYKKIKPKVKVKYFPTYLIERIDEEFRIE